MFGAMSRALLVNGLLLSCCVAAAVHAAEFSWDLAGAASQSAVGTAQDTNGSGLSATYYFDSVDDSQGPYSLATFFDPASRVSLEMNRARQTSHLFGLFPPGFPTDLTITTDDYTIGGQYWLSASKWYAGGAYTTSDVDPPPGTFFSRQDSKAYRVFAGKYLGPKTSLELGLKRSVQESGSFVFLCPDLAVCDIGVPVNFERKATIDDVGMSFEHVRRFRSLAYSLFGSVVETTGRSTLVAPPPFAAGTTSLQPYWTYSFGAEAFPTNKLGVRVGYTRGDYESSNSDSYDVAATWFFKRNIGIQLAWSRSQTHLDYVAVPSVDTTNIRFFGRL
jgi:hypothetical protein